jgi:hypothetical protein
MNPGPNLIGPIGLANYGVLVNPLVAAYKPGGITIDVAALTALTTAATYPGGTDGMTVPVGEKYIPAGTIMIRQGSGLYRPAINTDTLVKGECYITDRAWIQSIHSTQFGPVFDTGTVFQARLQVGGGAQQTLTQLQTAFPRVGFYKD